MPVDLSPRSFSKREISFDPSWESSSFDGREESIDSITSTTEKKKKKNQSGFSTVRIYFSTLQATFETLSCSITGRIGGRQGE